MSLYLYLNGQRTGPFTDTQVSDMMRSGAVTDTTLGWKEGLTTWLPVANLLPPAFAESPPSPVMLPPVPTAAPTAAPASIRNPLPQPVAPLPMTMMSPPAANAKGSVLGMISLGYGIVAMIGWGALILTAGLAQNSGTATETFNMIIGFIVIAGIALNFVALLLGIIGALRSGARWFP